MIGFDSPELSQRLQTTLRAGEKTLWTYERAAAPISHKLTTLYVFLFTIIWLVGMAWVVGVIGKEDPAVASFIDSTMFIPVFLIAAVQLTFSAWCMLRWNRFAYAVTDQRVLILNEVFPPLPRSFGPKNLTSLMRYGGDEKGSIKLLNEYGFIGRNKMVTFLTPAILANIPEPAAIENLIYTRLVRPLSQSPSP